MHPDQLGLVGEIGINHDGNIDTAMRLIEALSREEVGSVKLQYRSLSRSYGETSASGIELGDEIVGSELARTHLTSTQFVQLRNYAQKMKLRCGVSFFTAEDIQDFGNEIHSFDFFKVPSVELENVDLIDQLLRLDRLVLISTGGHSEAAVSLAFGRIEGFENWLPMHAVMNYPTATHNAKLGYIRYLAEKWKRPVGYSSHDVDWEVCLIAAMSGASVVERHVTHNHSARGLDHSSSSEPTEMGKLSQLLADLPLLASGYHRRASNQGEKANVQNLGRSYYSRLVIPEGRPIMKSDFDYRSPRIGYGPTDMQSVWGNPLEVTIPKGRAVSDQFVKSAPPVSRELIEWADNLRVGIPVRPGDFHELQKVLPLRTLEFHLSFGDIERGLDAKDYPKDRNYSIHLPDYATPTELLDPFNEDDGLANLSLKILATTRDFAEALQDVSQQVVPVVGSFSVVHSSLPEFYTRQRELVEIWKSKGATLLHQWLPPYAWYFGGSVPLSVFNTQEAAKVCADMQIPLCLDSAHLAMSLTAEGGKPGDFVKIVGDYVAHAHLAGSSGIDSEGVALRDADAYSVSTVELVIALNCNKILERWQGHLVGGQGFIEDLQYLHYRFR